MKQPGLGDATSVLLVEDDADFADSFGDYLTHHGMKVAVVERADDLPRQLTDTPPGLLILDQFVGDIDMRCMLPDLRARYPGPIVMLSGNSDYVDRILCLETGADDFISKSVDPREILAKLRSLLRFRDPVASGRAARPAFPDQEQVVVDGWCLVRGTRLLVAPSGAAGVLSVAERDVLWLLMAHQGELLTADNAEKALEWIGPAHGMRSLAATVSRLRQVIHALGGHVLIEVIRHTGYRLHGFDRC